MNATRRPEWMRSNRGRNRSGAQRGGGRFNKPFKDDEVRRSMRKRARKKGQADIRDELHVLWLESELQRNAHRWRSMAEAKGALAYLEMVMAPQEIESVLAEAKWEDDYMDDMQMLLDDIRDEDYAEDELFQYRARRFAEEYVDDDGWGDYYEEYDPEPEPTSERWRDLWVMGRVSDPSGVDYEPESYYPYCDDDLIDDEIAAYDAYLQWRVEEDRSAPSEALNEERMRERYRAGERYFRQTKRTVEKGLITERRVRAKAV